MIPNDKRGTPELVRGDFVRGGRGVKEAAEERKVDEAQKGALGENAELQSRGRIRAGEMPANRWTLLWYGSRKDFKVSSPKLD